MNNFGERQSLEELFDKLKSVTFKTNSVDFYNDIKTHLRSLNNKTIITLGTGPGTNECAKNNMKTALNIFREKLPEPLKTIITCRNPDTLEIAMDILFLSGYAYYTTSNGVFNTTPKQFNKHGNNKHKQEYRNQTQIPQNTDRPQQNNPNNHNNFQGNKNYRPRPNQGYKNNNQINRNFNGNNYQPRDNYFQQNRYVSNNPTQPNFQNNWKPNFNHGNRQPVPKQMDINMVQNQAQTYNNEQYFGKNNQAYLNTEQEYSNYQIHPNNQEISEHQDQNKHDIAQNVLTLASGVNYPI